MAKGGRVPKWLPKVQGFPLLFAALCFSLLLRLSLVVDSLFSPVVGPWLQATKEPRVRLAAAPDLEREVCQRARGMKGGRLRSVNFVWLVSLGWLLWCLFHAVPLTPKTPEGECKRCSTSAVAAFVGPPTKA